jgi:hypothetical protein
MINLQFEKHHSHAFIRVEHDLSQYDFDLWLQGYIDCMEQFNYTVLMRRLSTTSVKILYFAPDMEGVLLDHNILSEFA